MKSRTTAGVDRLLAGFAGIEELLRSTLAVGLGPSDALYALWQAREKAISEYVIWGEKNEGPDAAR